MKTGIVGLTVAIAMGAVLCCVQAAAQLKFADGTTQTTAFGGANSQATGANATVSGGTDNTASGNFAAVSGGTTNTASGEAATVAGGFGNQALQLDAAIGGGSLNIASGINAVITGGTVNTASAESATVGGGAENTVSAQNATVGGGFMNEAGAANATIAGGNLNLATGDSGAISGGFFNDATNLDAVVGGGSENVASGVASTVPGGSQNIAAGDFSFAAGFGATVDVTHPGATLFADSSLFFFFSERPDEFAARATGGVRLVTGISSVDGAPLSGVVLLPGGGTWFSLSDRNAKENIEAVDVGQALDKVLEMPIQTWNYKTQDEEIRHMGPMAQDFHAAFGLGPDERHIGNIDADGVALAAIQGLHQRTAAENNRLAALLAEKESAIAELRADNAALAARLAALEQAVSALQHVPGSD